MSSSALTTTAYPEHIHRTASDDCLVVFQWTVAHVGDLGVDSAKIYAIKDTCPVRVICAGAGFSGVCAAIRLLQHIPNLDLVITATGFDTSYLPRYPVVGRGGVSLEQM
ncbi:hypothetical protein HMPREF1624_04570 [Sporothrix schenckii ATCC 58251]|uniref:FAD/NAD(P)-binding domain-containing protein n=1 Tax=Sporothrix schenckii (strain ATCC 58251 / de Perez 2211183) TaxID=1391915 RepID=U7PY43_SPOS1|nr:hypothetical protein HMPREF1624_04570 [Sporothrix schenckii ATCC 58251]